LDDYLLSYWEGDSLGALLNFGRVCFGVYKTVVSFNQVAELTKSSLSIGTAPNSFSMTANLSFSEEITPIAFMYGSECWDSLMKGNFCWMRIWMHKSILVVDFNRIEKILKRLYILYSQKGSSVQVEMNIKK